MSATPSPSATGAAGPGTQELAAGSAAAVRALQVALTAEHAAVYGYGVAGAHLAGARQKAAARAWAGHMAAQDTLAAMITALGAEPVAAAPAYRLPFPVRNAPAAILLAAPGQPGRVSSCSMTAAAASRSHSAAIRSAHGHQNHQLPSRQRAT